MSIFYTFGTIFGTKTFFFNPNRSLDLGLFIQDFGVRVFFYEINLRDSGFFTFAVDYLIVTIRKECLSEKLFCCSNHS